MTQRDEQRGNLARWDGILTLLALTGILALLLAAPGSLLDKTDRAAYAVCHRIPERTFTVAGRPLPLCARCSGTYLGALAGFVVLLLRGRGRSSLLPAPKHLAVLGGFLLIWGVDGLNSYLTFFPGLPHLYEPSNVLRLATGALEGLVLSALVLPVFNFSLWAEPAPRPVVENWGDLAWLLVGGAAVVGLVSSEWAPLLYPLALVSGLMVVVLFGIVNSLVLVVLLRRDGQAHGWRDAAAPLLLGFMLAMVELEAIGAARTILTARLGLPF
jgi:uncharacterized membrane protein